MRHFFLSTYFLTFCEKESISNKCACTRERIQTLLPHRFSLIPPVSNKKDSIISSRLRCIVFALFFYYYFDSVQSFHLSQPLNEIITAQKIFKCALTLECINIKDLRWVIYNNERRSPHIKLWTRNQQLEKREKRWNSRRKTINKWISASEK